MSNISNNKRIAKNTLALYFRMGISIIVGLYTSRIVLQTLGVEDFGNYGIVGSVVSMMSFLNASMSGATSRFLTFELGKGDKSRLSATFSSAMIVHIIIALIVFVIAETIGLWFLCNKLVIPEARMDAAHLVFQLSIFTAMVGITQVPYNAIIISNEKMDIYAYMEILNVALKLLIVYLLVIGNFDKLILYAALNGAVSVLMAFLYRLYCIRKFSEAHVHLSEIKKDIIKPMLTFSMWDLYGNCSVTIKSQGDNFLINMFFGVVYNAAANLAGVVFGAVMGFTGAIIQAFRPHLIKLYAQNKIKELQSAAANAIKYSLLLMSLLVVPLLIETNYVFKLWLETVPAYAISFCRLVLISGAFGILNMIFNSLIHATGRIKHLSIITGSLFWIQVPIIYLLFKWGADVTVCYWVSIGGVLCILCSNLQIVKKNIPSISIRFFILNILVALIVILPIASLTYFIQSKFEEGFNRLLLISLFYITITCITTYRFILDLETRSKIRSKLRSVFIK